MISRILRSSQNKEEVEEFYQQGIEYYHTKFNSLHSSSEHKHKHNEIFVGHVQHLDKKSLNLLYLDGTTLSTTRTCYNKLSNINNIWIPEYNKEHYNKMFTQVLKFPKVHLEYTSLLDMLPQVSKIDAVYLDYCGYIDTTSSFNPVKELKLLMDKINLPAIICCTFNISPRCKNTHITDPSTIESMMEEIVKPKCNSFFRYRSRIYKNSKSKMIFLAFELK